MLALNESYKKVLRTLKTKLLQNFDNLRKIAGGLISTTSLKKEKMVLLLVNPYVGLRQRVQTLKSRYYSSNSNSPFL